MLYIIRYCSLVFLEKNRVCRSPAHQAVEWEGGEEGPLGMSALEELLSAQWRYFKWLQF